MKKVAIQGIKGSFHEEASTKFFKEEIETVECNSFKATCAALKNGEATHAALAIENTIAGTIITNYQLLRDFQLKIIGEIYLPIQLHLLAVKGNSYENIKTVQSHPMAIRQCHDFFEKSPEIALIEKADTAACAKEVAENNLVDTAAIASAYCAELYGLDILEKRIEKHKKNYTRFLMLAKESQPIDEPKKVSLSFRVSHGVGALAKVLTILAEHSINLTKIQSLPLIEEPDNYQFYVDIHCNNPESFEKALILLIRYCSDFSILGEYLKNDERQNIFKA